MVKAAKNIKPRPDSVADWEVQGCDQISRTRSFRWKFTRCEANRPQEECYSNQDGSLRSHRRTPWQHLVLRGWRRRLMPRAVSFMMCGTDVSSSTNPRHVTSSEDSMLEPSSTTRKLMVKTMLSADASAENLVLPVFCFQRFDVIQLLIAAICMAIEMQIVAKAKQQLHRNSIYKSMHEGTQSWQTTIAITSSAVSCIPLGIGPRTLSYG